jgi:hypothetical protein
MTSTTSSPALWKAQYTIRSGANQPNSSLISSGLHAARTCGLGPLRRYRQLTQWTTDMPPGPLASRLFSGAGRQSLKLDISHAALGPDRPLRRPARDKSGRHVFNPMREIRKRNLFTPAVFFSVVFKRPRSN